MDATVVGFEEDGVDFAEERFDGIDDFDVESLDFLGVFGDAFRAAFDVLTALGVGGDDAHAFETWFVGGIFGSAVEGLGECDGVGGIEADDADTNLLWVWGWCGLRLSGEGCSGQDCEGRCEGGNRFHAWWRACSVPPFGARVGEVGGWDKKDATVVTVASDWRAVAQMALTPLFAAGFAITLFAFRAGLARLAAFAAGLV